MPVRRSVRKREPAKTNALGGRASAACDSGEGRTKYGSSRSMPSGITTEIAMRSPVGGTTSNRWFAAASPAPAASPWGAGATSRQLPGLPGAKPARRSAAWSSLAFPSKTKSDSCSRVEGEQTYCSRKPTSSTETMAHSTIPRARSTRICGVHWMKSVADATASVAGAVVLVPAVAPAASTASDAACAVGARGGVAEVAEVEVVVVAVAVVEVVVVEDDVVAVDVVADDVVPALVPWAGPAASSGVPRSTDASTSSGVRAPWLAGASVCIPPARISSEVRCSRAAHPATTPGTSAPEKSSVTRRRATRAARACVARLTRHPAGGVRRRARCRSRRRRRADRELPQARTGT